MSNGFDPNGYGFPTRAASLDTAQELKYAEDISIKERGDAYQRNQVGGSDKFLDSESHEAGSVPIPPYPGSESAGPALFDLIRETRRAAEVSRFLVQEASSLLARRRVVEKGQANADAAGNLDVVMYSVPAGFELEVSRVVVESANSSPAGGYTNAAAWIAVIQGDRFALGSILDFLPNLPTAAGGFILPAQFGSFNDEVGYVRGPNTVGLHITGGAPLANVMISFRLQGRLHAV